MDCRNPEHMDVVLSCSLDPGNPAGVTNHFGLT